MCLPYLIDQLQVNLEKLSRSKEEIEKAREMALRAQQLASMGQFAADIAHELSHPLTSLVAFSQLMRDDLPGSDARREDLSNIIAEAVHCREIMGGLESFARQREPQWEQVEIGAVIEAALAEMEPLLAAGGAEVRVQVLPGLPSLLADPALLRQVLINLLTNSLESMDGPGAIEVSAELSGEGQSLSLTIRDPGRGIDPSLLPRLFQPFVTTQAARPGAGLGLAVAHGIVQTHGGEIGLESRPGHGTTVTLLLPLHLPRTSLPESAKILVVDDDPDFLEQHRLMLTGMGFQVVTADRSDEALELAGREIPDAFVLDLMMERTDSGARLARALRRDPRFRRAPIILLTSVAAEMGFEFNRNPREVLDWMKADAWFDKPAPVAELAGTLRRLLAGEKAEEDATYPAAADGSDPP
jgi:nitrogen-specific signal transduction histidine kinase